MTSVSIPTFKRWQLSSDRSIDGLELVHDAAINSLEGEEVLVEMYAASLNFMDLYVAKGGHPGMIPCAAEAGLIPGCDGAGIVKAVGPVVGSFKPGDRVVTHILGQIANNAKLNFAQMQSASVLGMSVNGTITQYAVFHASNLVRAPSNLSFAQASTLPCSALTAYNALFGLADRRIAKDDWVLVQGTGGVSVAALQLAVAIGTHVVATTSSEAKAEKLRALGAKHVLNYCESPQWGTIAREHTPKNSGFDHIIDVGGDVTLPESLKAIKTDGVISVIGLVGGPAQAQTPMLAASYHACIVRGLVAGTREQMKELVDFVESKNVRVAVDDEVFDVYRVRQAYVKQDKQQHFSKVVIQLRE